MRVCHIITRLIVGGAQENTILTCEGLAERGHDVTLMAGPETGPEGSLWPRADRGRYAVRVIPSLRRAVHPVRDWLCQRELVALLRGLRPDVVHTHSSKAGILGRMAAAEAGVPLIAHTIHGMSFNRTQPWYVRRLFRALERSCGRTTHAFIAVAQAMARQARDERVVGDACVETIYSGIETELFDPAAHDRVSVRRRFGFNESHVVVGSIARLFPNKGYEQLLAAMPALAAALPQVRFLWVGDGAARGRYERRLGELGLRDRVRMTGLVPSERVAEVLAAMDLLVHLSQWEGLPRAVVQALLMRVPAVSFDNDGAPEVVLTGRTGEPVPFNDVARVIEAVRRLAGDEALRRRYGEAGRELALERFDHRVMVDRIDQLYQRLSKRR